MTDSPKHLLLVDDETALREAIAERLADHGFEVEQADSGEQALERLAEFAFDILITDLRLPGIDGAAGPRRGARALPRHHRDRRSPATAR